MAHKKCTETAVHCWRKEVLNECYTHVMPHFESVTRINLYREQGYHIMSVIQSVLTNRAIRCHKIVTAFLAD